jgi:hypothetical protein
MNSIRAELSFMAISMVLVAIATIEGKIEAGR